MTDHSAIEWRSKRGPRGTWAISAVIRNHSAQVTASWRFTEGYMPAGPDHVMVAAATPASAGLAGRGVTTGVLRAAEPLLVRLVELLPGQLDDLAVPNPMEQLRLRAEGLGGSPRNNPNYYDELLPLFDDLEAAGSAEPVKDLADLLDINRDTVKTQLRAARKKAASSDASPGREH